MIQLINAFAAALAALIVQRMQLRRLQQAKDDAERAQIIAEMRANLDETLHPRVMSMLDEDIADG